MSDDEKEYDKLFHSNTFQRTSTILDTDWPKAMSIEEGGEIISFNEFYNRLIVNCEEAFEDKFFDDPPVVVEDFEEAINQQMKLDTKLETIFFFTVSFDLTHGSLGQKILKQVDTTSEELYKNTTLDSKVFENLVFQVQDKKPKEGIQKGKAKHVFDKLASLVKQKKIELTPEKNKEDLIEDGDELEMIGEEDENSEEIVDSEFSQEKKVLNFDAEKPTEVKKKASMLTGSKTDNQKTVIAAFKSAKPKEKFNEKTKAKSPEKLTKKTEQEPQKSQKSNAFKGFLRHNTMQNVQNSSLKWEIRKTRQQINEFIFSLSEYKSNSHLHPDTDFQKIEINTSIFDISFITKQWEIDNKKNQLSTSEKDKYIELKWKSKLKKLNTKEDGLSVHIQFKNDTDTKLKYFKVNMKGNEKTIEYQFTLKNKQEKKVMCASSIPWIIMDGSTEPYKKICIFRLPEVPIRDTYANNENLQVTAMQFGGPWLKKGSCTSSEEKEYTIRQGEEFKIITSYKTHVKSKQNYDYDHIKTTVTRKGRADETYHKFFRETFNSIIKSSAHNKNEVERTKILEFFGLFFDPNTDPSNFRFIKSGNLGVQYGTRQNTNGFFRCVAKCFKLNRKLTCFLTEDGFTMWKPQKKNLKLGTLDVKKRLVYIKPFDNHVKVQIGSVTGYKYGIKIRTGYTNFTLVADSFHNWFDWIYIIISQISQNIYCKTTRYKSFAPERSKNQAKWFIDTEGYYNAIYSACKRAKNDIFICDWWLHPKIYLKRPICEENERTRIDLCLKDACARGVNVKVLMYHESPLGCGNNSLYTKHEFEKAYKELLDATKDKSKLGTMEVLRHPSKTMFFWSHHEKMVIVDQKIGFLGGIDICLGRYEHENPRYLLYEPVEMQNGVNKITDKWLTSDGDQSDRKPIEIQEDFAYIKDEIPGFEKLNEEVEDTLWLGKEKVDSKYIKGKGIWSGKDYHNGMQAEYKEVNNWEVELEENKRDRVPRMPRRDIAIMLQGGVVEDMTRHFTQYWNFVKWDLANNQENLLTRTRKNFKRNNEQYMTKKDEIKNKKEDEYTQNEEHDFIPKNNYNNDINKALNELIGIAKIKNEESENDQKFVPKNYMSEMKDRVMFQRKDSNVKFAEHKEAKNLEDIVQEKVSHNNMARANLEDWKSIVAQPSLDVSKTNSKSCQILRSGGNWSLGIANNQTETSIMNAYIEMIQNAEHYVYIENQFFISSNASRKVKNDIIKVLIDKLKQKIKEDQVFKVIIAIPLVPGHAGNCADKSGNFIRLFLSYENKTIGIGRKSIIESVKKAILLYKPKNYTKWYDYVKVYGFRTHDLMPTGEPVTEIIYIHSKLLIVDDKSALIGSANLNDRSMLGSRDTELACVITDKKQVPGKMTVIKKNENAGNILGMLNFEKVEQRDMDLPEFAYTLRKKIWQINFGQTEDEVEDALSDKMWREIDRITKSNMEIYRELWGVVPDNKVQNINQMKTLKKEADKRRELNPNLYFEKRNHIRGIAVPYQFKFLKDTLGEKQDIDQRFIIAPEYIFL